MNLISTKIEYFDLLCTASSNPVVSNCHPLNILPTLLPNIHLFACRFLILKKNWVCCCTEEACLFECKHPKTFIFVKFVSFWLTFVVKLELKSWRTVLVYPLYYTTNVVVKQKFGLVVFIITFLKRKLRVVRKKLTCKRYSPWILFWLLLFLHFLLLLNRLKFLHLNTFFHININQLKISEKINFPIKFQVINQKGKRRTIFNANRPDNSNHHPIQFFL